MKIRGTANAAVAVVIACSGQVSRGGHYTDAALAMLCFVRHTTCSMALSIAPYFYTKNRPA
jgi:hypothetical protein